MSSQSLSDDDRKFEQTYKRLLDMCTVDAAEAAKKNRVYLETSFREEGVVESELEAAIARWQHNFAAIYGWEALSRIKGFSPPEMHLPNHPDAAYEYVKTLRECGYQWLLVQEHTVETLEGHGLADRHVPQEGGPARESVSSG